MTIFVFATFRLISVAETWFLKQWGEAYSNRSAEQYIVTAVVRQATKLKEFFDTLPSPETNVIPWLYGFLVLAVAQQVVFLISNAVWQVITYTAGRQMFKDALNRIAGATFRFYDVTVSHPFLA